MSRAAATIGWGLFCASSWTWCIGMYLPIILIRHWGWPGFWVFAIPNVLGCAGFGYLLSKERSERLCAEHAPAMTLFSAVTVAFQIFFVAWLGKSILGETTIPAGWLVAAITASLGLFLSILPDRAWPLLGSVTTLASLTLWLAIPAGRLAAVGSSGDQPASALTWAAPIVALGFLLCPWLDRTFHRARQRTPSVHAFGVFGLSFFFLILLTVGYQLDGFAVLVPAVAGHLLGQAAFTTAVHLREVRLSPVPHGGRWRQAAVIVPIIVGALSADLPFERETVYLVYLGAYGLLFPAYVLLMMLPAALGRRPWPRTRGGWVGFALLLAVLAPCCFLGFVDLETWLLPIPVVMLMVAAFAVPRAALG